MLDKKLTIPSPGGHQLNLHFCDVKLFDFGLEIETLQSSLVTITKSQLIQSKYHQARVIG
jgi:hypothetical protein